MFVVALRIPQPMNANDENARANVHFIRTLYATTYIVRRSTYIVRTVLMAYKILHHFVNVDETKIFSRDRSGINLKPFVGYGKLQYTFRSRVILLYNAIPNEIKQERNLGRFSNYLKSKEFRILTANFIPL